MKKKLRVLSRAELNQVVGGIIDFGDGAMCRVDCPGGGEIVCVGDSCAGDQGANNCFGTSRGADGGTGGIYWRHCPRN
jgi:hypothetical protein